MPELVKEYHDKKSILGICLGHQCIGEFFGAKLHNMANVAHGKGYNTKIIDPEEGLFKGVSSEFISARYHSWIVSSQDLPDCLKVTAIDEDNQIMGISHKEFDIRGLQFHPESILTDAGKKIMTNWIES